MHIASKPSKYGIKIWTLADSKSFYVFNHDVYLKKHGTSPEVAQGKRVVEDLMQPLFAREEMLQEIIIVNVLQ